MLVVPRKALLPARDASKTALAQNVLLATIVSSGSMTQMDSQDLAPGMTSLSRATANQPQQQAALADQLQPTATKP